MIPIKTVDETGSVEVSSKALGINPNKAAARRVSAAKEAYLTNAIPGPKAVARDVAKLAVKIVKELG